MRAILFQAPRKVQLVGDAPRPEPGDGEVIVQCSHVGLCGSNMAPYLGEGLWSKTDWPPAPGWLGHENIGTIVESRCDDWPVGTAVLAHPLDLNGFAEFILSNAAGLARMPSDAADPGGFVIAQPLATVLRQLGRLGPVANRRCAVVGQGPIGLIFTYLLRRAGAIQVIAVDPVGWRLEWSRRLGATDVVEARGRDTVEAVTRLTGGAMVDLAVDAVGTPEALNTAAMLPRSQGMLCAFGVPHHDFQEFPWFHVTGMELTIVGGRNTELSTPLYQAGVDLIAGPHAELTELVTPRLPWERAAEAFEMYAYPAEAEGSLKLLLVL